MKYKKILTVMAFALVVTGCATNQATEEWIELELTDNTYYSPEREFQHKDFEVLVYAGSWIEYKILMQEGDAITYSWTVEMENPELLGVEFHGHTEQVPDEPGTVMFYKIHNDGQEQGALIAPFDGVQGWYLNNESSEDVYVKLTVAGFFEEIEQ